MKLLFDLLPVIVFYGFYNLARRMPDVTTAWVAAAFGTLDAVPGDKTELSAVIAASACAIVATVAQVGWLLARRQPVRLAVWISAGLVVVFGGLTVLLHNEWFIKWKPSILYWTFTGVLVLGKLVARRNLLGLLLSEEVQMPPVVWDRLLVAWTTFFFSLGAANLWVAYHWSTDAWVNFKTFGLLGATFVFAVGTAVYMARFMEEPGEARPDA